MAAKPKRKKPPPKRAPRIELNERQLRFARAFAIGPTAGVATASARAAGYTGKTKTLETTSASLKRHPGVQAEILRLRDEMRDASIADAKERGQILSKMARGELRVPLGVGKDGSITYGPPKASDRRGAAELLAKMSGELNESRNVIVSGPAGGPIEVKAIPPSVARAELVARLSEQVGPVEAERTVRLLLGEPALVTSNNEPPMEST